MLTIVDIPHQINALHEESKKLAREIIAGLAGGAEPVAQAHGTDIIQAFPSSIVFIAKGIYKCFYNEKFVRFYSAGDIAINLVPGVLPMKIAGEMATAVVAVASHDLAAKIQTDRELREKWLKYSEIHREILHALCASYAGQDFKPDIDLRQYEKDDEIIKEGDNPDCIFEMIEGSASVTVKGTEVGTVGRGEVFGEISFLTASPRSASVVATSHCLVQAIQGGNFEAIVKYRPTLVHSMARTIAKRLTDVNERLVRIAGLT